VLGVEDDCGVFDSNPDNQNATCTQDCNGDWGGSAVEDACGVCGGSGLPTIDNGTCNACDATGCTDTTCDEGYALADGVCSIVASSNTTICAEDCDYTSINAAIAAAEEGDVLELKAETYILSGTVDTLGKAITLLGATDEVTGEPLSILDGSDTHRSLQAVSGETSTTVFENLVLQMGGPSTFFANASTFDGSSPTVRNCTFRDNSVAFVSALYLNNSNAHIINSRFTSNSGEAGIVMIDGESDVTIEGSEFTANSLGAGSSLFIRSEAHVTVRETLVHDNNGYTSGSAFSGISLSPGGRMTLERSVVCNNRDDGEATDDNQIRVRTDLGEPEVDQTGSYVAASCDDCPTSLSDVCPE
jgi:hypothetical protein